MEREPSFNLESPKPGWLRALRSPFHVSGWLIPAASNRTVQIEVRVNGSLRAVASRGLRREDVAKAYPVIEDALWSGFFTQVLVDDLVHQKVELSVRALCDDVVTQIAEFRTRVEGFERIVTPRPRSWTYPEILACPLCFSHLNETKLCFQCRGCKKTFQKRRGIPVFTESDKPIECCLLTTNPTNPNAEDHTRIIQEHDLVLDLGAGNPRESEHYSNVVFHESVHYAHTDVVSTCDRLPYGEGTFDAVISKATFEHLVRPWEMADEVYRVLKPGGLIHVDTAFMQPVHGYPYHFFNMTLEGAKEIFKRFQMLRCGIKPYQTPAYGLRMQIDVMLEHLKSDEWRRRLEELRDLLGADFDNALDARGRERVAAGVFFEGIKPL